MSSFADNLLGRGGALVEATLVDIDFTTLANNTFANGVESIAGVNWTAANAATANTWDILNGTGMRFNAAASSTVWDNTTRSCANLQVPILSLIPTFDPLRVYAVDVFMSSITLGTTPNRIFAGFLNVTGTVRLAGGGRRNNAGTQETYAQQAATLAGTAWTDDAFCVRIDARGLFCASGIYASGFPTYIHAGGTLVAGDVGNSYMDPTNGLFALAWPTGEAGGNMDVTIARLRIRKIS